MRLAAVVLLLVACGRLSFDPVAAESDANGVDASPTTVLDLGVGGFNTCVRLASGDAYCWGVLQEGGGGVGTNPPSVTDIPMRVAATEPLLTLVTGDAGSCAHIADGSVVCWGANAIGQLGTGGMGSVYAPSPLLGESSIVEIRIGYSLVCIRRANGTVGCAGDSNLLGDGTTTRRTTFGTVPGIDDAVQLALGDGHGCVLRADGSIWCWGANGSGQCGDGTVNNLRLTAVPGPVGPYTEITAGDNHTCGLRGGIVDCWGMGGDGALGDGSFADRGTAGPVQDLVDAVQVTGSAHSTCARRADATVVCWGGNASGELGDMTTTPHSTPAPVIGLTDVSSLSSNTALHQCALRSDASVWCWGDNAFGQLGRGPIGPPSPTAMPVVGLP